MKDVIIDTNILILLVVGLTSPDYISKHKRLKAFSVHDYELLLDTTLDASRLVVTPQILAETSNLLGHIHEPAKSEILGTFRTMIGLPTTDEQMLGSKGLASKSEFIRLGLADISALEASATAGTLLTDDLALYLAALDRRQQGVNFTHMREAAGLL